MGESLTLQTSDSNVQNTDVLGRLSFAASNESNTSDARLIGASVKAVAEGDFTEITNPTSLVFSTAYSETATDKIKITSSGHFLPVNDRTYDIGSSSLKFKNLYAVSGNLESLIIDTQTASTIASFDANKNVVSLSTSTYPSLTELSYVKGVTSSIQTQLNNKASSSITISAGSGLANGGDLSTNRTIDVGQGDGITVNADTVAVDSTVVRTTGTQTISGSKTFQPSTTFSSGIVISNQTASTIASFDASKNVVSLDTSTYPSLTELSYVKGVTSSIQAQINTKAASTVTIAAGSGLANGGDLSASRTLDVGQGDGITVNADTVAVDSTVVRTTGTQTISGSKTFQPSTTFSSGVVISNQTASTIASFDTNKSVASLATATYPSLTELTYVKGVTSAIQTQINTKAASTITISAGSGLANGGNLTANRTLDVGQGDGITVNADTVAVDSTVIRTTGTQTMTGAKTFSSAISVASGSAATPGISPLGDANCGIFFPAADTFCVSVTGVEQFRISSIGNVGIGNTPAVRFEVSAGAGEIARFTNTVGTERLHFYTRNSASVSRVESQNSDLQIFAFDANAVIFGTSNVERARIDTNGNLRINGAAAATSAAGAIHIKNGTAPSASIVDGVVLFAADVSASSELRVRDEAGNTTTLSPHNFSLIPEGPSEEMAWAFYSEKDGKKINVDMLKVIRLLEKLTGEKLVYET